MTGDELKALRLRKGLRVEELAVLLGVSAASVFGWEAGRQQVTRPMSRLLAATVEPLPDVPKAND